MCYKYLLAYKSMNCFVLLMMNTLRMISGIESYVWKGAGGWQRGEE
jgi:hypothetical protein